MVDMTAPSGQALVVAPPVRTDEEIVPCIRWVPIGKSNCSLDLDKKQSNPIFKMAVDLLMYTNFHRAFTASSTILSIYIQLHTANIREASYYQEYQANVAKHRRFLAGEIGSTQDSPAPKPAKPARKPKPTTQKAWINILHEDGNPARANIKQAPGRDVSEGKCAGLKGKKPKTVDNEECESCKQSSKKGDGRKAVNEKISNAVKERWDKKKKYEKKMVSKQDNYPFKLWASWMSIERSFQIKTLYPDHKCCKNYTTGALVTYKGMGLIRAVADWLPNAEHKQCTRHIYVNFKKR
uniref:Zinc finger, PMZ-type n=1 Tax=Tanacetum cinerariifolium TaxID=118510 RepID=A0A6L2NAI6_TANCI|nr:zinc finger, PMZ-type [Tanacetum cinerariifolium]